jgi:hypothetical protein
MSFDVTPQRQIGPKPSNKPAPGLLSQRTPAAMPAAGWEDKMHEAARPRFAHSFGQTDPHPSRGRTIQPKLEINTPGDVYEQEADRIAEQITHTSANGTPAALPPTGLIQRRVTDTPGPSAAPAMDRLPAASPGHPLDAETRQHFEARLGHDFSQVRVHTDPVAAQSARAIHARAYTAGPEIYFGAAQFSPGTVAGNRLLAHELVHVVQQGSAAAAHPALVQRAPDDSNGGQGAPTGPYPEEQEVIRYAVGARELGKLGAGTALYQSRYWKAAGLAADAFYAGPFSSDMGNIYYVYHITGADEKTSTYALTRATSLSGWGNVDVQATLSKVQGGQALQFSGTGLIAPTGGATATQPQQTPGQTGGAQPSGATNAANPQAAQADELTPQRKKWLTAGRENMKHEINGLFNEIQKVKGARIGTWEKNANIKDPKPARVALEVTLAIVSNGLGGVVGAVLTEALAKGLAQEFAKQALKTATTQLTDAIYKHIEPGKAFLANATQTALKENRDGNAAAALASQSTLLDCYVEATTLQTLSEEHVQTRDFNAEVDKTYPTDLALADFLLALEKVWQILFGDPTAFMRELSEGVIRLEDEAYVTEKAKAYGGSLERLLREDPHIHETTERNGNLLLLGPLAGIGKWYSPDYSFDGFGALATGVNNATLAALRNTPIKDLPLTLTFRFWGDNPYSGLFQDVFCKVWFERRSDGVVWVDFDESGPGMTVDNGIEWLGSYGSGISRELTDEERHKYAPQGALKVYEHVKDKKVKNLSNSDIF